MTDNKQEALRERILDSGISLALLQGDITRIRVGAIVNAANKHLRHGGGVAGAISHAGGPAIQQESIAWVTLHGPIDQNHPAYTSGGDLPCKFVIHTAGPVWGEGDEDQKLSSTITSAMELAENLKVSSVSMPAISTGIFGFPVERAAQIFMRTLDAFCNRTQHGSLKKIWIVLFDTKTLSVFVKAFDAMHWEESEA